MKKVLAISSVLLGVVFLAGCGQQPVSQTQPTTPAPVAQTPTQPVVTQQPTTLPVDETASWQTYKNDQYGYEIKYPTDWIIKDTPCDEKVSTKEPYLCSQFIASYSYNPMNSQDVILDNPNAPNGFIASISIYSNPKNITVKDFVFGDLGRSISKPKTSELKMGNITFLKEEGAHTGGYEANTSGFYAGNNGKVFSLSGFFFTKSHAEMDKTAYAKYQDTFNKMLATFKFTK